MAEGRAPLEEILDGAIAAEERAARTYRELARRSLREDLRELLVALAVQEERHREKLERVRSEGLVVLSASQPVEPRELAAPTGLSELGADASPAHALLLAIDQERRAFELYSGMAQMAADPEVRRLFEVMAGEEASHWHQLESAYDRWVAAELEAERRASVPE